jgi:uncharacterized membrane protein (UPF0136 family)
MKKIKRQEISRRQNLILATLLIIIGYAGLFNNARVVCLIAGLLGTIIFILSIIAKKKVKGGKDNGIKRDISKKN